MTTVLIGYVYSFSNPLMPGIHKVGYTERVPLERLKEANVEQKTYGLPLPYVIDFAIKVSSAYDREQDIHKYLTTIGKRINPDREFFRIDKEELRLLFKLLGGEWWQPSEAMPPVNLSSVVESKQSSRTPRQESRHLRDYFTNGLRIKYTIGKHVLFGTYESLSERILLETDPLYKGIKSITDFVRYHEGKLGCKHTSGDHWKDCLVECKGEWVSAKSLSELR